MLDSATRPAAERIVGNRIAELRDLLAHLGDAELARVDLDTPEARETYLAQRRTEWLRQLGAVA